MNTLYITCFRLLGILFKINLNDIFCLHSCVSLLLVHYFHGVISSSRPIGVNRKRFRFHDGQDKGSEIEIIRACLAVVHRGPNYEV